MARGCAARFYLIRLQLNSGVRWTAYISFMTRFAFGFNNLLFDPTRSIDRLEAGLLVVAVLAGIARSADGFFTCLALALLLRSRRAT